MLWLLILTLYIGVLIGMCLALGLRERPERRAPVAPRLAAYLGEPEPDYTRN
jgi:hypothetical protein